MASVASQGAGNPVGQGSEGDFKSFSFNGLSSRSSYNEGLLDEGGGGGGGKLKIAGQQFERWKCGCCCRCCCCSSLMAVVSPITSIAGT